MSAFADTILFNLGFHHSTSQPGRFKALCPGWMFHSLPGMDTNNDAMLRPRASKREHARFNGTHSPAAAAIKGSRVRGGPFVTDPGENGCLLPSLPGGEGTV